MNYLNKNIDSVIWLQTSFLGDVILNTAAFNVLKSHAPDVKQVLITTPVGAKALSEHPSLDHILVFDKKKTSLLKAIYELRKKLKQLDLGNSVILQAHKSFRSSFLTVNLPYPRITYEESSFKIGARTVPRVAVLHESQRAGLLLEPLGIDRADIVDGRMSLAQAPLNAELNAQLSNLKTKLVAMAPGSVWGTKRWPAESYAELAQKILDDGKKLLLLGSAQEEAQAAVIRERIGSHQNLIDLVGKTSLDDLRGIYPKLDLIVCNDSSPIHYASAFNVPTIAIFGATVEGMGFGPRAQGSMVLGSSFEQAPCRPCSDHGPQTCPLGHFVCMKGVAVSRVYDAITSALD